MLALAGLSGGLLAARRRPKGTLVVWWGPRFCLLDPADVIRLARLEELFNGSGDSTGWSVNWTRRAPVVLGPDGSAVLMPEQIHTVPTTPPTTFTWFPDGLDGSLTEEPPGRPPTPPHLKSFLYIRTEHDDSPAPSARRPGWRPALHQTMNHVVVVLGDTSIDAFVTSGIARRQPQPLRGAGLDGAGHDRGA